MLSPSRPSFCCSLVTNRYSLCHAPTPCTCHVATCSACTTNTHTKTFNSSLMPFWTLRVLQLWHSKDATGGPKLGMLGTRGAAAAGAAAARATGSFTHTQAGRFQRQRRGRARGPTCMEEGGTGLAWRATDVQGGSAAVQAGGGQGHRTRQGGATCTRAGERDTAHMRACMVEGGGAEAGKQSSAYRVGVHESISRAGSVVDVWWCEAGAGPTTNNNRGRGGAQLGWGAASDRWRVEANHMASDLGRRGVG